jgi:hypothetical protein
MDEKSIRKSLSDLLLKEHAHAGFQKAVTGIRPELRNVKPQNELHSIWDLVEHIRIGQEDIVEYVLNPDWKSPEWPAGYWPQNNYEKISDDEWDKSISAVLNSLIKMNDIILSEKIDLSSIIPHTKEHSYIREIFLIADHNAYHVGQIVLIRKLLNNW